MITSKIRLEQIKIDDKSTSSQRMIFLLNPRDTSVLQALVAWKTLKVKFDSELLVQQDTQIQKLWQLVDFDIKEFSVTLGCTVSQALPRLKQLKNLSLIYPDGTINQNARVLVNMFIRKKLKEVRGEQNE